MRAVFGVKSCNWGGCEGVLVNCASEPPFPILLSTPLSSLLNEKSSTNMSWCSWQPRNPKCCVKKKNTSSLLRASVTGCQGALWITTVLHLRWSVPLTHGDVCRSPVHGGSELSLLVLCGCQQTLRILSNEILAACFL